MAEPVAAQPLSRTAAGQAIGLTLFALGIVLLLLVFVWAYQLFDGTARAIGDSKAVEAHQTPFLQILGAGGLRVAFLFVMGYVSSLLASKGLHLFAISRGVKPD